MTIEARLAAKHRELAALYEVLYTEHGERSALATSLHHHRVAMTFDAQGEIIETPHPFTCCGLSICAGCYDDVSA